MVLVRIPTCYRLDGLAIEPWWGAKFSALSRLALGTTQPPIQLVLGFPRVKWLESGAEHPPLSTTKVKKRAELYFYSHSGPSQPVLG